MKKLAASLRAVHTRPAVIRRDVCKAGTFGKACEPRRTRAVCAAQQRQIQPAHAAPSDVPLQAQLQGTERRGQRMRWVTLGGTQTSMQRRLQSTPEPKWE